jgi:hypothetical protein
MRQKLAIVGTILLLIGVLFAINAATYVSKDETKDFELSPNRSTYHAGPTGTRALRLSQRIRKQCDALARNARQAAG